MARKEELTALLISPSRALAEQFAASLQVSRAFRILADVPQYLSPHQIDGKLHQLRPDVLLLDVGTSLDAACELIRFATSLRPPVHVIGLHLHNDSTAIVKSLRNGASEFLYAPFEISVQEAAVSRIQKLLQPETGSDRDQGKLVVFSSAKPGSGASTLAVQTAFALQRCSKQPVLLVDLDLMCGSLGFYLKLEPQYSIVDALSNSERLEPDFWSSLVSSNGGVDVLAGPELPHPEPLDPARLHELLQYARRRYAWVVTDLPSIFHRVSLMALSESDRAFLISTSELGSLHLARKAVRMLTQLGFEPSRFQLLVNRINKNDGINTGGLSKLFDCKVDASLPNDYFSLHRVVAMGEPLEADTELGRAIDGLASKLAGALPPQTALRRLGPARPVLSLL
ncbi:MAG: hypothetical protein HYS04_14230 [Acidobacteria bacterium]|nr:hypothetical protein [Acidobacteriota bacterium]